MNKAEIERITFLFEEIDVKELDNNTLILIEQTAKNVQQYAFMERERRQREMAE